MNQTTIDKAGIEAQYKACLELAKKEETEDKFKKLCDEATQREATFERYKYYPLQILGVVRIMDSIAKSNHRRIYL